MCRDRKPICLTAEDGDIASYSMPFVYRVTDRNLASSWKITRHNGMRLPPQLAVGCQRQLWDICIGWTGRSLDKCTLETGR